jgi:hypothetical protein
LKFINKIFWFATEEVIFKLIDKYTKKNFLEKKSYLNLIFKNDYLYDLNTNSETIDKFSVIFQKQCLKPNQ